MTHVPVLIRNRDRLIGIGEPVLPRYERIAFEKSLVAAQGQPLAEDEPPVEAILDLPECAWISRGLEQKAQGHAVTHVVPEHLAEVKAGKLALIAKTEAAVKERLTKLLA